METRNYTFDENIVSDLYKDAYGVRPGEFFWADWDACSDDAKQHLWDRLVDVVGESVRNEEAQQKKAIDKFEGEVLYALVGGLFRDRTEVIQHYHVRSKRMVTLRHSSSSWVSRLVISARRTGVDYAF
jgi:hypothetical protein